jgi:uncharacterized C2H2 Zn-finger protein
MIYIQPAAGKAHRCASLGDGEYAAPLAGRTTGREMQFAIVLNERKNEMLLIAQENTLDGERIIFNCPQCDAVNRVTVLDFCCANKPDYALRCPDCNAELYFLMTCLTRDAQLRIGADEAGQHRPLCTCGEGDAIMPELHARDCAITLAGQC